MVWSALKRLRSKRKSREPITSDESVTSESMTSEETDSDEELPQSTKNSGRHGRKSNKKPSQNPIIQKFTCTACQNLIIANPFAGVSDGIIKTKLGHLKSRAESGCVVCEVIRRALEHFGAADNLVGWQDHWRLHSEMPEDSESAFAARGEDYIPRSPSKHMWIDAGDLDVEIHVGRASRSLGVEGRVVVVLQGTRIDWETYNRSHPIQLYTWIPTTSSPKGIRRGWANMLRTPLSQFGPSYDLPRLSDDPHCLQTARRWVKDCLANHPDCQRKKASAKPQLPGRVLKVSGQGVRLLEGTTIEADYVTLSYCWGSPATQRLTTTKSNLGRHQSGIDWDELCKTHQDAITVTRALGFSYLWIDALCIVQDDPQEWAATASRMADIYENSTLTLCATWSAHSDGGLFSDRYAGRRDLGGSAEQMAAPHRVHEKPPIDARFVFKQHFYDQDMKEAHDLGIAPTPDSEPLLTRGWCMQERLLSRRTIDFTREEMYWECKTARRCECKEADRRQSKPRIMDFSKTSAIGHVVSRNSRTEEKEEEGKSGDSDAWRDLVTTYTAMSLTYASDRLPALSGLAHRFYETKGDVNNQSGYLAGIWQCDLLPSILWHIEPHMTTGVNGISAPRHVPRQGYFAPSWSWASREGQVHFSSFEPDADLQVLDATCTYGTDICGHCSEGSLTICGRLTPATLKHKHINRDPNPLLADKSLSSQKWSRAYWIEQDGLWGYIQADTELGLSGHEDFLPSGSRVFLLRFGWERAESATTYTMQRASCGLVLRYLEDLDRYVRIGKFTKVDDVKKLRFVKTAEGSKIRIDDYFEGSEVRKVIII